MTSVEREEYEEIKWPTGSFARQPFVEEHENDQDEVEERNEKIACARRDAKSAECSYAECIPPQPVV